MCVPTDLVWRFRDGEAFFEYHLDSARRLGRHFNDYAALLAGSAISESPAKEQATAPATKFRCGSIIKRVVGAKPIAVLTEIQTAMLNWVLSPDQPGLVESVIENVSGCYSDKKPDGWWDLRDAPPEHGVPRNRTFMGYVPSAPRIPAGYAIEDFFRISDIYLHDRTPRLGVRVSVGWSEGSIGLQYEGRRSAKKGSEKISFPKVSIGPGSIATD